MEINTSSKENTNINERAKKSWRHYMGKNHNMQMTRLWVKHWGDFYINISFVHVNGRARKKTLNTLQKFDVTNF